MRGVCSVTQEMAGQSPLVHHVPRRPVPPLDNYRGGGVGGAPYGAEFDPTPLSAYSFLVGWGEGEKVERRNTKLELKEETVQIMFCFHFICLHCDAKISLV
jgi:hypothetical protein